MSLIEVAGRLNKKHEAEKKAAEDRARQSELHLRRLSYFREFGGKWFQNLKSEMDSLIEKFNEVTGSHSKLLRISNEDIGLDSIAVQFIESVEKPMEERPVCICRRSTEELKVTVEIEHVKAPLKEQYDLIVEDFSEIMVGLTTTTVREELGEGVKWKDRETGEMNYEPTFVQQRIRETRKLYASEFADWILSTFAEKML